VHVLSHGGHTEPATDFLRRSFVLGLESAPALLLAYLVPGLVSTFLSGSSIRWIGRGGPVGVLLFAAIGFPT